MPAAESLWLSASPASARVLELARKVAATSSTVLITGESGVGKDQLALFIHDASPRREAPCLKIDCASLPPALVESELFGHERGAFTGAVERKPGRFELARAGTLVLDEIAALAAGAQAKLLRVLEERTFERLGGTETLRMDARIIALTNTDLPRLVRDGRFREDLYFRLNVVALHIPPLRERHADIPALAAHLLARLAALHGRPATQLAPAAERLLTAAPWPGNVRELKNALERAHVFSTHAALQAEDFPELLRIVGTRGGGLPPGAFSARGAGVTAGPASASSGGSASHSFDGLPGLDGLRSLEDVEREHIAAVLEATRYKIGRAAEILGVTRKTLLEKRKKYKLD